MNWLLFFLHESPDFKHRTLKDVWSFDDKKIERTHDFIQILFPLSEKSGSSFHGLYLDDESKILELQSNPEAKNNIIKSAAWFYGFLERNQHWHQAYDHNHLRITRVIKCLRLLVSDDEANKFRQDVLTLISDNSKINQTSLDFWNNA